MSGWFSFGNKASAEDTSNEPKAVKALPASWYRSEALYKLERRAIFSKKWLVVTHQSRFINDGDYIQITEAGFTFFLIKDRKGEIRAHHNVCRHRAYPLVSKDSGHLQVLACKYHGWSYGFDGKLAKAPKYQELPSFDKSKNGLFGIHVHVDRKGFVWINLDASEKPTVAWEEDFADIDQQPRLERFDMSKFSFDHQWGMIGNYNWKALADNYNECYHCPTGHPGVNAISDLSKYWVETTGGHIQHWNTNKEDVENVENLDVRSSFYYPNASITISSAFMYIQRCIPLSATQTKMEYEVYRHADASDEDFKFIDEMFKQVLKEDKELCEGAQKNLNGGIFVNGELHPRAEKGPLYFQAVTRQLVMDHREKEEALGKEIWPATPRHDLSEKSEKEADFCSKLDCTYSKAPEQLAW